MSKSNSHGIVLLAALCLSWLYSNAYAVNSESLSESQKKYRITELERTDEFNIRVALKQAIEADTPGIVFHWHNPHTNHNGTIITLNNIGLQDNGRICVDLVHVYYSGETPASRNETTICKDKAGYWNDASAQTTSSAPTHLQLYTEQTVQEVQNALTQLRYAPGSVDGIYGSRTRRAIKDFQQDEGMPVSGNITDQLLIALKQTVVTIGGEPSGPGAEAPQTDPKEPSLSRSPSIPGPSKPVSTQDIVGTAPADSLSLDKLENRPDAESTVVVKAAATPTPEKPPLGGTVSNPILKESSPKGTTTDAVDSPQKSTILGTRALTDFEEPKKLAKVVGPFDSIWSFAIVAFSICCIVGAFASWFLTSKVNSIGTHRTQLEQAEAELNAKIALVTRRFDHSSVPVPEGPRDDIKTSNPPPTRPSQAHDSEERLSSPKPQHDETTSSFPERTGTTQASTDRVVAVNDAWLQQRSERVEPTLHKNAVRPTTEKVQPTSQDATETIKQADEFIDVIEAIKEAEELIKEAQRFLKADSIERASQDYITNAIKQATEVIKETLRSGSIEGDSSQEITKALKNASELIKRSLTKGPVDGASQLRPT